MTVITRNHHDRTSPLYDTRTSETYVLQSAHTDTGIMLLPPILHHPLLHLPTAWCSHTVSGVAELGGPGGPWPPQKFEWVGQGMLWPPQNFDHWPPQNGPPVVKISAKLLLSILKCAKFFACGGLIWVELIPQVISCFFRANSFTLTCNIL